MQLFPLSGEGHAWQPDNNLASCAAAEHHSSEEVPNQECSCGLYAYHSLTQARRRQHAWAWSQQSTVIGLVAARGQLQIHRQGFRAPEARIVCLFVCLFVPLGQWVPETHWLTSAGERK